MDLKEWLFRNRVTQIALARKLQITRQHMGSIVVGRYKPGRKLIAEIVAATGGQVTAEEVWPVNKQQVAGDPWMKKELPEILTEA